MEHAIRLHKTLTQFQGWPTEDLHALAEALETLRAARARTRPPGPARPDAGPCGRRPAAVARRVAVFPWHGHRHAARACSSRRCGRWALHLQTPSRVRPRVEQLLHSRRPLLETLGTSPWWSIAVRSPVPGMFSAASGPCSMGRRVSPGGSLGSVL